MKKAVIADYFGIHSKYNGSSDYDIAIGRFVVRSEERPRACLPTSDDTLGNGMLLYYMVFRRKNIISRKYMSHTYGILFRINELKALVRYSVAGISSLNEPVADDWNRPTLQPVNATKGSQQRVNKCHLMGNADVQWFGPWIQGAIQYIEQHCFAFFHFIGKFQGVKESGYEGQRILLQCPSSESCQKLWTVRFAQ
ncbi:unnamed protein product [Soboliphyme baturini]|uniref:F-box protein n=1 Tax=Soboliphyme baturini TaxID=241478 RepID=A0A183J2K4_9BILA|nr:unnamed protein product [Soboliphyme baturini]